MSYSWRRRLFLGLLPLFLGAVLLTTRVESDLNTFFTATDSEDAAFLAGFLQSGELSRRYLIALQAAPGATGDAGALAENLARVLAKKPEIERVWSTSQPPENWIKAVEAYAPFAPRIYSLQPQAESGAIFAVGDLKTRALALKQALLSPQGDAVKRIAPRDPLLLSLEAFRELRGRLKTLPAGGTDFAGVILQSRAPSLDTDAQRALQEMIRDEFDRINSASSGGGSLSMTGVPVFTVAAHDQIGRDVAVVSTVSTLAVVLIFLILFRSLAALHWVVLIVAASFAAGTLATSLVFGAVHSLTLALGSTLTGVSIDYPMHVLAHTASEPDESPDKAISKVWTSLFVGALTTILGYLALGFTGFPGFQQIAVFSAAAIAATLLLTRAVLPAFLKGARLRPPQVPGLSAWIDFCRSRRRLLQALSIAILAATATMLPNLRWLEDLSSLTMDMSALHSRDESIRNRLSSVEVGRFVLVTAPDRQTALQYSEAAELKLRQLKRSGQLQEFFGLYPWLVSQRLQEANAAAYDRATNGEFRSAWNDALRAAGLSVKRLGSLSPAATIGKLTPPAEVDQILSGQVVPSPRGEALVIWLGPHHPAAVAAAIADLPGVRYFSQRDLLDQMAQRYRDRALVMLGAGLAVIYLLLSIRYRSARKGLLSLLPALIATCSIFVAWAALGEAISFVHVMCLLLAVSICEDYGIFYLDNGGGDIHTTYQAIAPSMLTTAVSFAALGLADNPTLRVMSVAVTFGVLIGFLLCPLLIAPHDGRAREV